MKYSINASTIQTTHIAGINSNMFPSTFYQIPHMTHIKKSKIGSLKNMSREHESEVIYTNPIVKDKQKQQQQQGISTITSFKDLKYNYAFNTMIQVNSEKIHSYFDNDQYSNFFNLILIYITSLFNGSTRDQILQLYQRQRITDSVYIFTMKCLDIIDSNEKSYKYIKSFNPENLLSATEGCYKIRLTHMSHLKEDALLLLSKFQVLLGVIDKVFYEKEMKDIEAIYIEFQ